MTVEARLALNAARAARGEPHYPAGALKLGCGGCRPGDMARHPELGVAYCAVCPVTRRKHRAEARARGLSTYRWQGVEIPVNSEGER